MTRLLPCVVLAASLLAIRIHAASAQTMSERKLWLSAEGSADLTRKLRLNVEQQLRLDGGATGFDETLTELSLRFRIAKFLRIGAAYRFIVLPDEQRHRGAGEAQLATALGAVRPSYRARLEVTTRPGDDTQTRLRNRLKVAVNAPHRLEPFLAGELIHVLSPRSEFREVRLYAGTEWQATDELQLSAFYLFQDEHNMNAPERNHIVGLGASYRFRSID